MNRNWPDCTPEQEQALNKRLSIVERVVTKVCLDCDCWPYRAHELHCVICGGELKEGNTL
jgi:hypothetical protein